MRRSLILTVAAAVAMVLMAMLVPMAILMRDYALEEEAADVVRVARLLDDGAPVHLVGHSLGGVIVRAAAIQDPSAFRDVVQFCSGPYGWPYRKVTEPAVTEGARTATHATRPRLASDVDR